MSEAKIYPFQKLFNNKIASESCIQNNNLTKNSIASNSILEVPTKYRTIKEANDAARPGDTIYVRESAEKYIGDPESYDGYLHLKDGVNLYGDGAYPNEFTNENTYIQASIIPGDNSIICGLYIFGQVRVEGQPNFEIKNCILESSWAESSLEISIAQNTPSEYNIHDNIIISKKNNLALSILVNACNNGNKNSDVNINNNLFLGGMRLRNLTNTEFYNNTVVTNPLSDYGNGNFDITEYREKMFNDGDFSSNIVTMPFSHLGPIPQNSASNMIYSNVQLNHPGMIPQEGCFYEDPQFEDPNNGDFRLKCMSLCINTGDPVKPYYREPGNNGSRIDMGVQGNRPDATEACITDVQENNKSFDITVMNNGGSKPVININMQNQSDIEVKILNDTGHEINRFKFSNESLQGSLHIDPFKGKDVASGVYFYTVKSGDQASSGKILLLK